MSSDGSSSADDGDDCVIVEDSLTKGAGGARGAGGRSGEQRDAPSTSPRPRGRPPKGRKSADSSWSGESSESVLEVVELGAAAAAASAGDADVGGAAAAQASAGEEAGGGAAAGGDVVLSKEVLRFLNGRKGGRGGRWLQRKGGRKR